MRWKRVMLLYSPVWVTGILGIGASLSLFSMTREWEYRFEKVQFEKKASERVRTVYKSFTDPFMALESLSDLFYSSDRVTREEFRSFSKGLFKRHPSVYSLMWVPRLEAKALTKPGESSQGQKRYPVRYIEPFETQRSLIGLDLAGYDVLRSVMDVADRREIRSSPVFRLGSLPFKTASKGMIFFKPIFKRGGSSEPLDAPQNDLMGFLGAAVLFERTMDQALSGFDSSDIDLLVYRVSSAPEKELLYTYGVADPQPAFLWTQELSIGSQRWRIQCAPAAWYRLSYPHWDAWLLLALGLALTFLVANHLLMAIRRRSVVEGLVEKKTRDLSELNRILQREIAQRVKIHQRLEKSHAELESRKKELLETNERLRDSSRLKDEFIATASHELRNPLTAVKEGISLVLDNVLGSINEDQKDFLSTVDKNVNRLSELINNLLDLSKIEAGRMDLVRRRVSMKDLVRSSLVHHKLLLGHRKVHLDAVRVPDAFADPNRIHQVLENLLSNAVKFTSKDGIIHIGFKEQDEMVWVSVEDNGIGIAPEDLPKLFTKFSKVGQGRKRAQGAGLGLVICRELIRLHKGEIRVESQPNRGSKFIFSLPRYSPAMAYREYFEEQLEPVRRGDAQHIGILFFDAAPCLNAVTSHALSNGAGRIQTAVEFIERRLHAMDVVAPYGTSGILIMAAANKEGLRSLQNRIPGTLSEWVLSLGKSAAEISIPVGMAIYPDDGTRIEDLISKAMESLRESRRAAAGNKGKKVPHHAAGF